MQLPRPEIDPTGLLEYSVVFTDRSLNHAAPRCVAAVQTITSILTETYGADQVAIVPGGGTAAMEAVARAYGHGHCLILRTGYFSYRWTQIFDAMGKADVTVLTAAPTSDAPAAGWAPPAVEAVTERIRTERPAAVFAAHVETAAGIELPVAYLRAIGAACREVGAVFVLDCIASGAEWVDLREVGCDVLLSAPQKGWSGTPGTGYVMLTDAACDRIQLGGSFLLDLRKWLDITRGYVAGTPAYHATLPGDTLLANAATMTETRDRGLEQLRSAQRGLGTRIRTMLAEHGFASVAAPGYEATSVVVVHTPDPALKTGAPFAAAGVRVAAGVPLMCGEGPDFATFRLGLFGLDKWGDPEGSYERLAAAVRTVAAPA